MSVLGPIVKENRKSLQPPAAASHSRAKNINATPFCEHDLSCWPNLLQSVLGHVFGSLYFKRKQTTFPLLRSLIVGAGVVRKALSERLLLNTWLPPKTKQPEEFQPDPEISDPSAAMQAKQTSPH